jgi:hypothetical protein
MALLVGTFLLAARFHGLSSTQDQARLLAPQVRTAENVSVTTSQPPPARSVADLLLYHQYETRLSI